MKEITSRQKEILSFIEKTIAQKGYPPTVREIAEKFKLASAAGVHKHIKALVKKNFLAKEDHLSRSLQVVKPKVVERASKNDEWIDFPLAGYVAAGHPIEAIEQTGDTISLPAQWFKTGKSNYVLKVRGDSMIDEFIMDGDYVVMEPRETANNGEVVVALIQGREATLKRFYKESGQIRLQPANPAMEPIILNGDEVAIQGVVVGLWRNYK